MAKIRLDIPNKNAKEIELNGEVYVIPRLTLYHKKYIPDYTDESQLYEMIYPLIKNIMKVDGEITSDVYEYLVIKLLEHNNILKKEIRIDGELFKLEDLYIDCIDTFEYDGIEYKFKRPSVGEEFTTVLDGLNSLQIDSDYDFKEMAPIFFSFAFNLFNTVRLDGEYGGILRGLDTILDNFINHAELSKYGGI